MEWALALVAVGLLAVATVSRRIVGTPVTPAILFVGFGPLVGREGLHGSDLSSTDSAVRLLAEATLAFVLFADASRIDLGQLRRSVGLPLRLLGVGLAADDSAGRRRGRRAVRKPHLRGGVDLGDRPGPDRRCAWAGRGDRAASAATDPPGTERRRVGLNDGWGGGGCGGSVGGVVFRQALGRDPDKLRPAHRGGR